MLSKTSLGLSHILASTLADQGVELHVVENSALDELTRESTSVLELQESVSPFTRNSVTMLSLSEALEAGSTATADGNHYPHDAAVERVVDAASTVLASTLDLTQNKVKPAITRVVDAINEIVTERLQGCESPLTIIQRNSDVIFSSHFLQENVQRYRGVGTNTRLQNFGLSCDGVASLAATGHSQMDADLQEFCARVGAERIQGVHRALFCGGSTTSSDIYGIPSQAENAVIAYFLAVQALLDIPEGLNTSLEEWKSYCASILASAGSAIDSAIVHHGRQSSVGPLVMSAPSHGSESGTIEVNGPRYADYLAKGGSVEALFGSFYETQNFDVDYLLANQDRLTQYYERSLAMYRTQIVGLRVDAMVAGAYKAITAEINAIADDELRGAREDYHQRLRERMRHAKGRDFDNLWHFARKAVCRVLYPHTDAEVLLLGIEEQAKIYPDTNPRELALRASVDLVANWLAEQIAVTVVR